MLYMPMSMNHVVGCHDIWEEVATSWPFASNALINEVYACTSLIKYPALTDTTEWAFAKSITNCFEQNSLPAGQDCIPLIQTV
jgi:hypothetical protein